MNYDFEIEFLPSKMLGHADGLSRLIPRTGEPLEDTVIAALRSERDYSAILCNTVKELPVTLEDIKRKLKATLLSEKLKKNCRLTSK